MTLSPRTLVNRATQVAQKSVGTARQGIEVARSLAGVATDSVNDLVRRKAGPDSAATAKVAETTAKVDDVVAKAADAAQATVTKAAPKVERTAKKAAAKTAEVAEKAAPVKEAAAKKAAPVKDAVAEKAAPVKEAVAEKAAPVKEAAAKKAAPAKKTAAKKSQAKKPQGKKIPGPDIAPVVPGERLAAETAEEVPVYAPAAGDATPGQSVPPVSSTGGGATTEPSATSRDDAHGDTSGPAEDLTAEAGKAADVVTPVGTTGAGTGSNPDTAESDLQQPGTQPLVDPSLTKGVKSEEERGLKDAE